MKKRFGVMLDMSRNAVMKPEELKKFAATIKKLGYNMIQLYTEDTYEVPGEPYFGYMRGRYTCEELKAIDDYCFAYGIELVPCLECYGHMEKYLVWPEAAPIKDTSSVLLAREEKTFEFYAYDFGMTWNAGYALQAEGVFGAEGVTEFDQLLKVKVAAGDAAVYKLRFVR